MKYFVIVLILFSALTIAAQPSSPVRMVAEWEPALGTLIRWPLGIPEELVYELASEDTLYVLVSGDSQQDSATYTFNSWNINMDNVVFITAPTNSHWTRDWGPVTVFDGDGDWGIVDFIFEGYPWVPGRNHRIYQLDNAVNSTLADFFAAPLYEMPLYFTGGNVMIDGYGSAFSTQQMLDENSAMAAPDEFYAIVNNYTGINNYQIVSNFESYGIQHIDCVAKLLDEETVLIKRLPFWHPEYDMVETIAQQFAAMTNCFGRPYKIHRVVSGSYSGNSTAAYTNSLILNNRVYVPLFGIDTDDDALQAYADAMPGYEIIGIYYNAWYSYDALHCRTMGIFDRNMLHIAHRPLDSELADSEDIVIAAVITPHSNEALIPEETKVYWRIEDEEWESIVMAETGQDSLVAAIPMQSPGTTVNYYIQAADESGRSASLPRTPPDAFYSFTIFADTSFDSEFAASPANLLNYPNPFNPETTIQFYLEREHDVELEIFNIKGQKIQTLFSGSLTIGNHSFIWNAEEFSSGLYFVRLKGHDLFDTRKLMLLK